LSFFAGRPIAHMYEPPRGRIRRDSRWREASEAVALGRFRPAKNLWERTYAARSCLAVRPGWERNRPFSFGTVATRPLVRSGRSLANPAGPSSFSARAFSISRPSPEGTVRARKMPMRAVSRSVQVGTATASAANSPGSFDGSLRA
jgi:hypothetical protein